MDVLTTTHQWWQQWQQRLDRHAYWTPWFVLQTTFEGIRKHNLGGLSAALSFYALFALIPLTVLIFFLFSHLVYASDYAIVKLAMLTGNLLPEFSQHIMTEVYQTTQTKAAWGMLGFIVLLWAITPLATQMRSSFYLIASRQDHHSFWHKKLIDIMAVLGILILFFLFTAAGFTLESTVFFLAQHLPAFTINLIGATLSLLLTTLFIACFYHGFCPMTATWKHLFLAALVTSSLWMLLRPAFGAFLSLNESFGAIFGGMKALFVSITWLYVNFVVFLIGIELLVTLKQKDVLLLKGLFDDVPHQQLYRHALLRKYGRHYGQNDAIIRQGQLNQHYYMVVDGTIQLQQNDAQGERRVVRILKNGDYFGNVSFFSSQPAITSAVVVSNQAVVIEIYAEYIDNLLQADPSIAVRMLKRLSQHVEPGTLTA